VSCVASATPRLHANVAALANWFFLNSCDARRATLCDLLLPEGRRMAAFALVAKISSCPLFHSSHLCVISALTAADDASGFWGPRTSVGKRNKASQAASLSTSSVMPVALVSRSVMTGMITGRHGLGRATAD